MQLIWKSYKFMKTLLEAIDYYARSIYKDLKLVSLLLGLQLGYTKEYVLIVS